MRIWIAAAVLIALAVIGLVAMPYAVEWERYRSDIEAAVEKMTGHDITINGPIDVTFLPRPILTAKDVTMASRADGAIGFELKSQQVDMGFRTGPLLVGRPIMDQLKLTRPSLALDQEASDKLKSWPPRLDDWSNAFLQPDLRLIIVTGGRLHLGGHGPPETAAVSELSLTLTMAAAKGPLQAAGLFKTDRHRFTIAAGIGEQSNDGSSTIKVEIGAKNGVDETTTLNLNGVLQRRGPEAGVQGRVDLTGPDLRSGMKAISVVTGSPSTFLSLAPNQSFRVQSRIQATRNAITSDEAKITLGDKFGGGQLKLQFDPTPNLDLNIDLPTVRLADDTTLIDFVPLDLLSVFPTTSGKVDIRMREVVYRKKAIRRAAITIVTDKGGMPRVDKAKALLPGLVDVQFNGRLRPSETGRTLSGQLTSVGDDLGETIRWLGLPLADQGNGWRGFSLESNVSISSVNVALSAIDMRLDTSKIEGKVGLRFSERLGMNLDVDVERLNLDLYAAEGSPTEFAELVSRQFEELDASIDARFQRLSWKGLRFEEATLSAAVEQRHFKIDSFALQTIGDTAMTIEGEIDLQTEAVDLTTELTSQFPTRVLRHLDIGLPLASTRLEPLTLSGWVTGKLSSFDVGLRADYDDGQWLVEGRAGWIEKRAHYDLAVMAEHPDHRVLAGHFGLAPLIPAEDAPGPFEINGQLRHDQNGRWITAGSAKLGPTSITGRLTHQDMTTEDKWEARVSIGDPRRDSLAPFLTLIGLRSAGNWTPRSILGRLPQSTLRTAWLDDVDGSLSLVARGGLAGDGINLSARLDKGFLYVDEFEAALWNGDLSAEMSLERRREQPFASIAIQLDDVDAEALTRWLNMPKTIEGPLKLKLDAASVGVTAFDLVKGLSGNLSIEAGQGKLHSPKIPTFRKTLRDRLGASLETPSLPEDPLTMPLLSFKATSTLKRGIATLDEGRFTFDPGMGAIAEATLDGTLDLLLWVAELTLNVTPDDAPIEPLTFRIVGSPGRPQGFILDR